jgi:putative ABC transport system permease protein
LTFHVSLPPARSDAQLKQFGDDLASRLRSIDGVRSIGYAESLPMVPIGRVAVIGPTPAIPGAAGTDRPAADVRQVSTRVISDGFPAAMGMRVVAGRGLGERDGAGQPQVMLINETLARTGFLGAEPLGRQIYISGNVTFDPRRINASLPAPRPWRVVGVVADVRQAGLDRAPGPEIFVAFRQLPGPSGPPGSPRYFALRVEGDSGPAARSIRDMARQVDAQAMVEDIAPMEQIVFDSIARPRLFTVLLAIFAAAAALLAAIGIYGVMAYAVARRMRELGIRVALGAHRKDLLRLVLGQGLVLTGAGIGLGLAGAAAVTRYLGGMLFGLTPLDPATFIGVAALFSAVATMAAYVPARRATEVDPMIALRAE